jgi:molybdopterin synthase sulfurtransferase
MTSTSELAARFSDPGCTVLDVRPSAAYNGWRLAGEPRGGHVPGARSLPLEWTRFMDWVEVVERMGLVPSSRVTVYGYTAADAERMAGNLKRLGLDHVDVYAEFMDEWVADPDRPLRQLPRYRHLVHPGWLAAALRGEASEAPPRKGWVLCHAHFDNVPDYQAGHIPGAVPLDTNTLESPETWNRRSPAELERALLALGIRHDTTVVVYGRYSHPTYDQPEPGKSAGQLAAMRSALIMLHAGVEDVRVLNGGIHVWEAAGLPMSADPVPPRPATDFGVPIPARPEYVLDMPDARRLVDAPDGELVSVQSWPEYIGELSGYHYIERKGRIPGAIFGNTGSDAYHMENLRNLDNTTREAGEVARAWAESGITPEKHIAFYCGTGWRASEAFMNAWLMDWPRVSIYDGGWYEWSGDSSNDIATGPPKGDPRAPAALDGSRAEFSPP